VNITTGKGDIRVAIVGVGNCANSLVQGVTYYKDAALDQEIPGLMHATIGSYHISNVKFVAAFDVDAKKVGLDLADAIWASENNTIKFSDVAKTGVPVLRGVTNDGLGKYYRETITESDAPAVDVVAVLKEEQVDVLICYLPVGSETAAKYYAQCAIMLVAHLLTRFLYSSHPTQFGLRSSKMPVFLLWAMTLRARLAQQLHTASWLSCSKIAAFT